ncbi:MAG TPA: GNAT family N-acetyltransferase [Verrucomicrobiales bacterium]|nr:GNAT family N-acetyltransferase [Verrucomicrobiales bacterium]
MSHPAFHIREASIEDVSVIADFNLAIARETEGRELDRPTVLLGVHNFIAVPARGRYFVAQLEGAVVGQTAFTYEWSDWRNGNFWWLQSVYVHPGHRARGVFRALFAHIEALARAAEDCCGIRLYMERENRVAQQAYLKLGLRDSGYEVLEVDFGTH